MIHNVNLNFSVVLPPFLHSIDHFCFASFYCNSLKTWGLLSEKAFLLCVGGDFSSEDPGLFFRVIHNMGTRDKHVWIGINWKLNGL